MPPHLSDRKFAFATSKDLPDLTVSDRIAAEALRADGGIVVPVVWDDALVDWGEFSAIIIRSTWDYHLQPHLFRLWVDRLAQEGIPVWNPIKILRWNIDKRYLLDLETNGIPIPRTRFLDGKESFDLSSLKSFMGTDEVVVKPVVSASSWNTWRCSLGDFSGEVRRRLDDLLDGTDVMIQEFMPEIATEGEWSLIFFGERFSHAVRKYPREGDFRVQDELGGRYCLEPNPPPALVRQASDVLGTIEHPLLYARVDGIVRSGKLVVMELELLEPSLFFDVVPAAAKGFCGRMVEVMSVG